MEDEADELEHLRIYLRRKGAVELLCTIRPDGSRRTDLDELMRIDDETIDDRLDEARAAGIVYVIPTPDVPRSGIKYALTARGEYLLSKLREQGLPRTYQLYAEFRERYNKETAEFKQWVLDNEEAIMMEPGEPGEDGSAEFINEVVNQMDDEE